MWNLKKIDFSTPRFDIFHSTMDCWCAISVSSKSVRALLRRATGWFVSFKPLFPSAVGQHQQPKCKTDKHLKLRALLKMQELKCVPIFEYKCKWSTARKTNIEDRGPSLKLGNIPIRFMSLPHLQQQQQHVDKFCQGLWHFPRLSRLFLPPTMKFWLNIPGFVAPPSWRKAQWVHTWRSTSASCCTSSSACRPCPRSTRGSSPPSYGSSRSSLPHNRRNIPSETNCYG